MTDDGADPASFWDDPRVRFIRKAVLATHPKLAPGAKFDKNFQTEATR